MKGEKKYEIVCNNFCESVRVKCLFVGVFFILYFDIFFFCYFVDCFNFFNVLKLKRYFNIYNGILLNIIK